MARHAGLDEAQVALIDEHYADSALSERHKAAIRYADVFLTDPTRLDDALRAEMRRHFSAPEIVELTAALALFMGFSKIAIVLGQAPAAMPVTVVAAPG
mgnify:CR=1 FL=1